MLRFLVITIVVIALCLQSLPYVVRDQVVIWLLNNGAEQAGFKRLSINWWQGRIAVEGLYARGDGKPEFAVQTLALDLDYAALLDQRILLQQVELQGIHGGVSQQTAALYLGPIDLNSFNQQSTDTSEPETTDEPSAWSFGLQTLHLADIQWQTELPDQSHQLDLNQGALSDLYLWQPQQAVNLSLQGAINGAAIDLNSDAKPLPEQKTAKVTLKLSGFPVHSVTAAFLPTLRAHIDLDLTADLQTDLKSGKTTVQQQGAVRVSQFKFQQDALKLAAPELNWKGTVNLNLHDAALQNLAAQGQLVLQKLQLTQDQLRFELAKLSAKTALQRQASGELILKQLQLRGQGLNLQQPQQQVQLDSLNLDADLQVAANQDLNVENLTLALQALQLGQGAHKAQLQQLETAGNLKLVAQQPTLNLAKLTLGPLTLTKAEQPLLSLQGLTLGQTKLDTLDQIALTDLQLRDLKVKAKKGYLSELQHLTVEQLALTDLHKLALGKIRLNGSQTQIRLAKDRSLPDLDWLLAQLPAAESGSESSEQPTQQSKPFQFKIAGVELKGKNRLAFSDQGVAPAFRTELDINRLTLGALNSVSTRQTPFNLQAKTGFAQLDLKGKAALFSKSHDAEWQADIQGIALPQLSPYVMAYTGYYIHSGQLNLTSKGSIAKRQLKGNTDIQINRIDVEPKNSDLNQAVTQKLSMPLETAIMILQDNDGNIALDIPLSGDLNNPEFGYQSVINTLAGKGLKNAAMGYLSKALQPFGTLITLGKMVMDAKEKGSFISLQPVTFKPGEASAPSSSAYLAKLAGMLKERQAMRLNLCGISVPADKPLLEAVLQEENKKAKEPLKPEQLQLQLQTRLQQLAAQRSDYVKAGLIKLGVKNERLFGCYPQYAAKTEEPPQVRLGL